MDRVAVCGPANTDDLAALLCVQVLLLTLASAYKQCVSWVQTFPYLVCAWAISALGRPLEVGPSTFPAQLLGMTPAVGSYKRAVHVV